MRIWSDLTPSWPWFWGDCCIAEAANTQVHFRQLCGKWGDAQKRFAAAIHMAAWPDILAWKEWSVLEYAGIKNWKTVGACWSFSEFSFHWGTHNFWIQNSPSKSSRSDQAIASLLDRSIWEQIMANDKAAAYSDATHKAWRWRAGSCGCPEFLPTQVYSYSFLEVQKWSGLCLMMGPINCWCNYSSFHWEDDSMIDHAIFWVPYFQTNPSWCAVFVVLILLKEHMVLQQVLENVAEKCYFARYTNTISSGRLRHSLRCRHTFHFIVLPVDFCVDLWSICLSIYLEWLHYWRGCMQICPWSKSRLLQFDLWV